MTRVTRKTHKAAQSHANENVTTTGQFKQIAAVHELFKGEVTVNLLVPYWGRSHPLTVKSYPMCRQYVRDPGDWRSSIANLQAG